MEDINVLIAEVDARSKSNTHRIDKLEQRQDDMETLIKTVALIEQDQRYMKDKLGKIESGVEDLKGKSGKRWDAVVEKVLLVVVGAIVVYALSKIGF